MERRENRSEAKFEENYPEHRYKSTEAQQISRRTSKNKNKPKENHLIHGASEATEHQRSRGEKP